VRGARLLALSLALTAAAWAGGGDPRLEALGRSLPVGEEGDVLRRVLAELEDRRGELEAEDREWERSLELASLLAQGPLTQDQKALGRWVEALGWRPRREGWRALRVALADATERLGGLREAWRTPLRRLADSTTDGEVSAAVRRIWWTIALVRLLVLGGAFVLFVGAAGGAWWWRRRRRAVAAPAEEPVPPPRAPTPEPASNPDPGKTTARGPGAWIAQDPRFEEVQRLGSGGMGTVFGAREVDGGRAVAIKTLASLDAMDTEMCARFLREAQALERIEHPGLPAIHAVAEEPVPHMVMEWVQGMSLEEMAEWESPLEPDRVRRWMREAGAALGAAHAAGVVHRDVKPANLMVDDDDHVRVVDFGLAFLADRTRLTRTGQAVGTPAFMPREQFLGEPPTMSTDVYGLCATAYYLLTGEFPYHAMLVMHGGDLPPPRFPSPRTCRRTWPPRSRPACGSTAATA
jgi:hypothetical protein